MKITNKYNLPDPFVNLANKNNYKVRKDSFSATELLKGVGEITLGKISDELPPRQVDVSDMIDLIWGTAVHKILEDASTDQGKEAYLKTEINGVKVSGRIDLYDIDNATIHDYKTVKVKKIKDQNFDDWRKQGLIYAWLARKNGVIINTVKFHGLIKDWDRMSSKFNKDYPPAPIYTWEFDVFPSEIKEIEKFIVDKITTVQHALKNRKFPVCSEQDRWYTGTKYAVVVEGSDKGALYDTEQQAQRHYPPGRVEERKGRNIKCEMFCNYAEHCPFWKKIRKEI